MRIKNLWLGLALCGLLGSGTGYAAAGFDPDGERIVELVLDDNSLLSEGVVLYPFGDEYVFPLGEMARSLSLAIQISTKLSVAEGFVAQPENRFKLDLKNCSVEYFGKRETYDCSLAFLHNTDIYVHQRLFEKWIPSRLTVNALRAQVVITPKIEFPVQARIARERLAKSQSGERMEYDPGYPRIPLETSLADGLFAESQITLMHQKNVGINQTEIQHSSQLAGELLGFEATSLLSGNQKKFQSIRFSMARIAGNQETPMFGAMKVRELRLVDVAFPPLPLLSNSSTGRGIYVSTFRIDRPTTFETAEIQGPLAPGWEVVLYRNDVLIDRQLTDDGRYRFKAVPLYYGRNSFRLNFFGPQGERRVEYRNYNISPELLIPGEFNYRFGVSHLDTGSDQIFAEYAQNLAKYFTINTGIFHDSGLNKILGYAGLTGVNELFLFTTNCAVSSDGGKACEWGPQFGVENLTFGGKYTRLFNFHSDKFNKDPLSVLQDAQIKVNVSYFFRTTPGVNLTLEYIQQRYVNRTKTDSVTSRTAMGSGAFLFNNELRYTFGATAPVSGEWEITYVPQAIRYSLTAAYDTRRVNTLGFAFQKNQSGKYNVLFSTKYDTVGRIPTITLNGSKLFEKFTVGLNSSTNFKDYSLGLVFGIGGIFDSREASLTAARPPVAALGGAMVNVYKDLNSNGKRDAEDTALAGYHIKVGERMAEGKTDANGRLFLRDLRPHAPTDVAISQDSMTTDPYLRPAMDGYRIFSRAGKLVRLDLPVVVVGEIDGYVQTEAKHGHPAQPLRNAFVQLVTLSGEVLNETKTDEEGFFNFPSVKVGKYYVRLHPEQMSQNGYQVSPAYREATIEPGGSFQSLEEFHLSQTGEPVEGDSQIPQPEQGQVHQPQIPKQAVEPDSGVVTVPNFDPAP